MSKGRKANFLLLLAGSIAAVGGAEVVLRAAGLPVEYRAHSHPPQFQPRPEAGYLYLNLASARIRFVYDGDPRGYFGAGHQVDHLTNSLGFRGEEISREKPPDAVRFLFLGDSFTFGEGVRQSDTLPEQFRKAAALRKAFPDRRVEALNLGVGGFNTLQEVALLREVGMSFSPDWVILVYCLNDAEPALFQKSPSGALVRRDREGDVPENLAAPEVPPPFSALHLTKLAYSAYRSREVTRRTTSYYKDLYREGSLGWEDARRALHDIGELARGQEVRAIVVTFPLLFQLDGDYPFREIHAKIEAAARSAGLESLDLLPAFAGHSGPELWVHPTDQHPNEVALRLAATRLAEFVAAAAERRSSQ